MDEIKQIYMDTKQENLRIFKSVILEDKLLRMAREASRYKVTSHTQTATNFHTLTLA